MDTQTLTKEHRRSRAAILVATVAALGLSMALMIQPAFATHVDPTVIDGNASCGQINVAYDHEFKIDATPETKTYSDPNSDFEVDITVNAGATLMDFSANLSVDAVFVKGGTGGGNLYVYDPATTEDTGLMTPTGQQISHVSFCFNDVPEESPTPTPAEETATPAEETATPEESVAGETGTPEQSVAGATGTPAPSQPDTAMGALGGPSAIPTIAFALILLAALGTLAWANVKTARSRA
jgi:hypothetical protein